MVATRDNLLRGQGLLQQGWSGLVRAGEPLEAILEDMVRVRGGRRYGCAL